MIHGFILGHDSQQFQFLVPNLLQGSRIQFPLRSPVYDEPGLFGMKIQFFHEPGDPSRRLNSPAGAVADQNGNLHGGQDTPADMFHARLIVHHNIGVMVLQFLHLGLDDAVDKAVASLALGPSHDHKVIVVLLGKGVPQAALQIGGFGDSRRNLIFGIHSGPLDLLPEFTQGYSHFHPQHLVEVGVGVSVHRQHRLLPGVAQILD